MTQKNKLLLFFLFSTLLGLASFLIFRQKASAPHTILIQNSTDETLPEEKAPEEELETAKTTPEELPAITSKEVNPKQKVTESETTTTPAEKPTTKSPDSKIIQKLVSWGFSTTSNRKIDTIIIHSSYNALGGDEYDVEKLITEYKEYGVAPHYLIDRQGKIYQLVADKNIAYHAGESKVPDGRTNVNSFSLGIEMINTKEDKYTSDQYASLNALLSTLKSRYSIKYVLGHDDIAPGRKTDPWNFDWKKIQ